MNVRETLIACQIQFQFYAIHHRDKMPPDIDKAKVNDDFADRCRTALVQMDQVEALLYVG
jgi:hypothetical protein